MHRPFRQLRLFYRYFLTTNGDTDLDFQIVPLTNVIPHSFDYSNGASRILILSAMHGDEKGGVVAANQILEYVQRTQPKVSIRIISPVNEYGFLNNQRHTKEGRDINRDFSPFATAESIRILDQLSSYQPDIVISLHEGPHAGFFAFAVNVPETLKLDLLSRWQMGRVELASHSFFGNKLFHPGLMDYPYWLGWLSRAAGIYTLESYASKNHICLLTTEGPFGERELGKRVSGHLATFQAAVEYLSR